MILDEQLIYDKPRHKSENEIPAESKKVLSWIGKSKSVLEIGCHTGVLSEWIQKADCSVVGVDLNSKALEIAAPYLAQTIHADIEDSDFNSKLNGSKFDVMTILHVLEHLTNPWQVLQDLKNNLKDNGELIIALPNICNAKDRYSILNGEFNYTVDGVMDKTHLRFFNYTTAQKLIEEAGFKIYEYYSPWQVNPFHYFLDHIPLLCRTKSLFKKSKVPFWFRNKRNLTDTVMLFHCRLKT